MRTIVGQRKRIKPTKCKSASRYKGLTKPKCLDGAVCDTCWAKWWINQQVRKGLQQ